MTKEPKNDTLLAWTAREEIMNLINDDHANFSCFKRLSARTSISTRVMRFGCPRQRYSRVARKFVTRKVLTTRKSIRLGQPRSQQMYRRLADLRDEISRRASFFPCHCGRKWRVQAGASRAGSHRGDALDLAVNAFGPSRSSPIRRHQAGCPARRKKSTD